VSGLGTLLGAVATAIADSGTAAGSSGLNIALDAVAAKDFIAVWGDVKTLAGELGIKL
jgi:hypothetical protein